MVRFLLVLTAYFALAALFWFGVGSLNIPRYQRLATEGVQAEATITATTCDQHSTVSYKFDVGERTYFGSGLSGEDRPCKDTRVGDRMSVWYLPTNPTVSTLREPYARLKNEQISAGFVAIVMPAWLLFIVFAVRWGIQRAGPKRLI